MSDIVIFDNLNLKKTDSLAEDFVKQTKLDICDVSKKFFAIGYRLYDADRQGLYRQLGFENISDCAEHYFGFKKTTTYDLIKIYSKFNSYTSYATPEEKMKLPEEYAKFSQSQLVILASIQYGFKYFLEKCSPFDSVSLMKEAAKYWKKYYWSAGDLFIALKKSDNLKELVDGVRKILEKEKNNTSVPAATDTIEAEYIELDIKKPQEESISVQTENGADDEVCSDVELIEDELEQEERLEILIDKKISNDVLTSLRLQSRGVLFRELVQMFTNTPGISAIMRNSLANKCIDVLHNYLVTYKQGIRDILVSDLCRFDYSFILNGRKQGSRAFFGNVVDSFAGIYENKEKQNGKTGL